MSVIFLVEWNCWTPWKIAILPFGARPLNAFEVIVAAASMLFIIRLSFDNTYTKIKNEKDEI